MLFEESKASVSATRTMLVEIHNQFSKWTVDTS